MDLKRVTVDISLILLNRRAWAWMSGLSIGYYIGLFRPFL